MTWTGVFCSGKEEDGAGLNLAAWWVRNKKMEETRAIVILKARNEESASWLYSLKN